MRLRVAIFILLVLAAGRMVWNDFMPRAPLDGHASAVDGDTIRLGGERIRLLGLDAVERAQHCTNAAGGDWACGEAAQQLMRQLLGKGDVHCVADGHDRYRRVLARCSGAGGDLGAAMVVAGLAVADGGYLTEEAQARAARLGIWAGNFTTPSVWRHTHGEGAPTPGELIGEALRQWFGL